MNLRRDYLHKTSTAISKNNAVIVIEDFQGWHEFRRQLEYKQAWRGGEVLAVTPKNTSRTCPRCAHVAAENRQTQSRFACVACGCTHNADLNAAENILAAGHAVLACGEDVRPRTTVATSAKHEPAEGWRPTA